MHFKHCFRLLVCSVYVPSSHSSQFPLCAAVVQGDIIRVPNTHKNIFIYLLNLAFHWTCHSDTTLSVSGLNQAWLRASYQLDSLNSRCGRSGTPGRLCSGRLAVSCRLPSRAQTPETPPRVWRARSITRKPLEKEKRTSVSVLKTNNLVLGSVFFTITSCFSLNQSQQ